MSEATKAPAKKARTFAQLSSAIDKILTSAAGFQSELHEIMVECAMHVRDHGNTELCKKLVNGLLDSGAAINVAGIRKWFGDACPMTKDRDGKWTLMDKSGDTYGKWLDRLSKATAKDSEGNEYKAQPDETPGPGGRVFYVDFFSNHPFWTDEAVKAAQAQNIRVLSMARMFGQVYAIQNQYQKAVDSNLFDPEFNELAKEFLAGITKQVEEFKSKHSKELVNEPAKVAAYKRKIETGEIKTTEATTSAPLTTRDAPQAQVGGDVTKDLTTGEKSEDNPNKTGTEG